MPQILEGSRAIALTIKNIKPAVVSAYPITPQTHIVEDLAKFKADGRAAYQYVRAESEFAAASIVAGASASGARVYSASSSQGLLLMTEVLYNIAGLRLPVVLTCANRGVSAPITIWNDHQDAMTMRDAGWIMLFAENHQEAVDQHVMAYKIAERLKLPVMVNVDGFVVTHTYEPVDIPTPEQIKKYLPDYQPKPGQFLDPANPVTLGAFAPPGYYQEIRQELHQDLLNSLDLIDKEFMRFNKIFKRQRPADQSLKIIDNGLVEYCGPRRPKILLIALGSMVGTIKQVIGQHKKVGVLKLKCFRPLPAAEILKLIKPVKQVAVIEKAVSLGLAGPLAAEIKALAQGQTKAKIHGFIVGLGGRDVTEKLIENIIVKSKAEPAAGSVFIG